jgi:hypothetical protein
MTTTRTQQGTTVLNGILDDLTTRFGSKCVVFDLETTSAATDSLRITRGVALSTETRQIHVYTEAEVVFGLRHLLNSATVVIAQNHSFDFAALRRYICKDEIEQWSSCRVFDMLEAIRRETGGSLIGLGNLCHTNKPLVWKTGKGSDAITMWTEGTPESTLELVEYNIMDVLSTACLAVHPRVHFCLPIYDSDIGVQRHMGYGVLNTVTLRVRTFPNDFPPGFDETNCFCAHRARTAVVERAADAFLRENSV